jgi:hypothetical protein
VIAMTVQPIHGAHDAPAPTAHPFSVLAFGTAVLSAAAALVAVAVFAIAYAVGGADATSDNWVGVIAVFGLFGGLLSSVGAFALALFARVRHERTRLLWLPLALFPALLAFVVLGEAFWWE